MSVELRAVHKGFGDNQIVKGVDLACGAGEFLILVGPSGCGKSTTLRLIAGLESPDAGDIYIAGERVTDRAPKDRDIAMVFQSYALYPHMTVAENMGFALAIRKTPRAEIEARVGEVARMLGLEGLLERRPAQLSGGQRQRVAMGRAIVRKPKVFLFDEPLSNLDAALRGQMRVELKRLHARLGTTMVYVTHDQIEAMTLADRIAVLDRGLVQQIGSPAEIFGRPETTFVARFIGTPTINLVPMRTEPGGKLIGDASSVSGGHVLPELAPQVLVGVRPQALVPWREGHAFSIRARVDVVEPLGWEAHVHLRAGSTPLTIQLPMTEARGLEPGQELRLGAARGDLHLFDAKTERRVGPS